MREYGDDIRLYTPVLQRIIILVAVIIAVPVMLWTITAFVHTYVGPARAPVYQRTAIATPPDSTTAPSEATTPPDAQAPAAPAEVRAPATDTRVQLLTIKKPPAGEPQQDINASAPAPQIAPQVAAMSPTPAATQQGQPPADFSDKSDRVALPAPPPMPAVADNDAAKPVADDATTDALPATAPLAGRIPLPRTRPALYAMAQVAPSAIPLPRARPAAAPAAIPTETLSDAPTGYNPGLGAR
jgi:hypothetical protein